MTKYMPYILSLVLIGFVAKSKSKLNKTQINCGCGKGYD